MSSIIRLVCFITESLRNQVLMKMHSHLIDKYSWSKLMAWGYKDGAIIIETFKSS